MPDILEAGRNCWRVDLADRFAVLIDADEYFSTARDVMKRARKSILLIGWDFDARIRLGPPDQQDGAPNKLGEFILWLVEQNPELEIRLLQWNSGLFRNWFRGTNALYLLRWKWHSRITSRFDSAHPPAASHHQKIIVIDDAIAFCGGIDMTMKRWDTRAHADEEPGRQEPPGKGHPWHDVTSICDGDAAVALAELCRMRWERAGGKAFPPVVSTGLAWPKSVKPLMRGANVAIARSSPSMPGREPILEVESLYLDMIAAAKTLIYAESQYFASRRIASALARRLEEPDGPEIVLINPRSAEGWLEPLAMDTARARLVDSLRNHDRYGRFAIYHPVTEMRRPIYVHAKLMIVDDRFLRIGSSNFNNRSMRLDSECDLVIDALQSDGSMDTSIGCSIRDLRHDLLAEHLGVSQAELEAAVGRDGSMIGVIDSLRGPGRSLIPYEAPQLSSLQTWLADNEILDPDGPDEMFELFNKRGLFRGRLRKPR